MAELEGKVAVITGAGSGMGRATARVFLREGARVLGVDVSGREQETAEELGEGFVPFHADVSKEVEVEAMFAAALEAFGKVDAMLNVAGLAGAEKMGEFTVAEFDRIISVNLLGVMLGTKHAIRTMVPAGGGVILNWSSTGGMNGSRTPAGVYSASKAGVIAVTKQAAIEYGRKGIRANAICPGLTVTEMAGGREAIENFPGLVKGAPMGRAGEPEEVAELASFLASDRAPFITGAVIPIDGGLTALDTVVNEAGVYFDPYDIEINADPYPAYVRLRDEAPIYYNERYDFWALSRHADVHQGLLNWETFSSTRSDILDIIRAGVDLPPGVILFEDPPMHTMHRGLMSRVFTPRRMAALEDQIRAFCVSCLDPLVGSGGFDIVAELGTVMPMRVIGMLLGIPEQDQVTVRDKSDKTLRTKPGQPMAVKQDAVANSEMFTDYIEWRAEHPSDDLMTQLLNATFEDEHGETRTLTREEVRTYATVIAGAGNETTGRLIGWLAKVLAEHPDQRRAIVDDRSLIPNVIDETLRFESTGHSVARYVMHDVDYYGTTVPAGSAMLMIVASANRDPRRYENPDTYDIRRPDIQHLTFGFGLHYCLGANLARLEGRVALEEVLNRFPEWDVDYENIKLAPTSTVRGWERMPLVIP